MAGRSFRVLAAVVGLGLVLALVLAVAGLGGGNKALGASTTLTVLGGDVSVRHSTAPFVGAVDGEVLNPGDTIKTGASGRAVLTYFEGSSVTLEPATELAIDVAKATSDGSTIVAMTQAVGRTWHVVTKLITGGSKYEVRTPASTASVRGTAFTVDVDDTSTTVTTTEGTVVDQVANALILGGRPTEVPVRAGQQHKQLRGQPASETQPAPAPQRKVTITLTDENTLVIDTAGRANGIDKNGKKVLQTPGATLEVVDGHLVVTLPNIPDGLLEARTRKSGDVDISTTVEERGQRRSTTGTVNASDSSGGRAKVTIGGQSDPTDAPTTAPATPAVETPRPRPTQGGGRPSSAPGDPSTVPSPPSAPGGQGGTGSLGPRSSPARLLLPVLDLPLLPGASSMRDAQRPPDVFAALRDEGASVLSLVARRGRGAP